jgi:hypothetical protein
MQIIRELTALREENKVLKEALLDIQLQAFFLSKEVPDCELVKPIMDKLNELPLERFSGL